MDAMKVAIPVDVATATPKLMGSDVVIGARVCSSDDVEPPKIDDFRGTATAGSPSCLKKTDAELCRRSCLSKSSVEEVSLGLVDGITSGSTILMSEYERKQIQRKVGKVPRNISGSFKKQRILQSDNLLSEAGAHDAQLKSEQLGSLLFKTYNTVKERTLEAFRLSDASCGENMIGSQSKDLLIQDKSQAVKLKNNVNGKRGDRRNSKCPTKAKPDPFSPKVGASNLSHANGGSNPFGMYGLKPDVHDISKLTDDISLNENLDGTYKCPDTCMDKGKKVVNVAENILDSVKKACSLIRLRGVLEAKQAEEIDIQVNKKIPLLSSPSNTSVGPDGDDSTLSAGLLKCGKDLESPVNILSPSLQHQPRDILERLALPPSKDLDSLLEDALKPLVPSKLSDSRNGKQLSNRVSLPTFPWSHNFNGHYKSNNESMRMSNKSTCQGRWVRIRSNASFIGGGNEDFMDLDSLTYDNSLVPAGKVIYRLPEIENGSASLPPSESGGTVHSKLNALHSPSVLAAAQTLCYFASDSSICISNGILKWPKQLSQKSMKARKSRFSENSEELFTPKLEDHEVRSIEHVSSSKKPKFSMIGRREDISHVHTVIGLTSVSAPRSNRSSPSRLPRDSIAEARNLNGSYIKPSNMMPHRVLDRNSLNPQKSRKISPMDWNRTRS